MKRYLSGKVRGRERKPPTKDYWDKADVIFRGVAGVFIPAVVAISVYLWNAERTRFETASNMLQIAVGILQQPADTTEKGKALRNWAISVMRSPHNPPEISEEVAAALATDALPKIVWTAGSEFPWASLGQQPASESVEELLKKYNPQPWKDLFDCTSEGCTIKTEPVPPEELEFDWGKAFESVPSTNPP